MLTRVELIFVVLMVSALILIAYEMLKVYFRASIQFLIKKKPTEGIYGRN